MYRKFLLAIKQDNQILYWFLLVIKYASTYPADDKTNFQNHQAGFHLLSFKLKTKTFSTVKTFLFKQRWSVRITHINIYLQRLFSKWKA